MTHTFGHIFRIGGKSIKAKNDNIRKMFELEDGTIFQTENNNAQSVRISSCDCKIIYDGKLTKHLKTIRACKEHKSLTGQALLNKAFADCKAFQDNHPKYSQHNTLTEKEKEKMFSEIRKLQNDNRIRIKNL